MLASHLQRADVVPRLANANVIELGAGCGVPGLAAWSLGARRVLLTDLEGNLPRLSAAILANPGAEAPAVSVAAHPPELSLASPPPLAYYTHFGTYIDRIVQFRSRMLTLAARTLRSGLMLQTI